MNEALQKQIEGLGFVVNPEHPDQTLGLKVMSYGYIPEDDVLFFAKGIVDEYPVGSVLALNDDNSFIRIPKPGVEIVGMYKVMSYNAWRAYRAVQLEVLFEPLGE